ncbi:hypothetical protein [Kitasatospora sp. NPDC058218]|uniref:hypothetical protein n=1 Tax=Kitasatospora sp. NPDC058218 TaxID=3346385 RepID=UPI0036D9BA25
MPAPAVPTAPAPTPPALTPPAPPTPPLRAAYVFDRTLAAADPDGRARLLDGLAITGLTTLVTKAYAVTPALAAACRAAGLRLLGSLACLSDHAEPAERRRPDLRPVSGDGRPWQRLEWYDGLVPTDPVHGERLAERCAALAGRGLLDGLVLDFLRWPLHWELELRPGARPRDASYDPTTLADFTRRTGITVPADPVAARAALTGRHREHWLRYRREVITGLARDLLTAARRARPGLLTGLFLVPEEDGARRARLVGQCAAKLAPLVDALLPMSYHAILHRPPAWVGAVAGAVRAQAAGSPGTAVVPVVQTTSSPALARGADWGPPVTTAGFRAALGHALDASGGRDLCLFPGEGLDGPKARALADALD